MPFDPRISLIQETPQLDRLREFYTELDEKKKDEQKLRAREFKANQEIAEVSFGVPKDVTTTWDADRLKGFITGQTYNDAIKEKQSLALGRMAQYAEAQRRAVSDEQMAGFAGEFSRQIHPQLSPQLGDYYESPERYTQRPEPDTMAAFASATQAYPQAAADERFGAFVQGYDRLRPADEKAYEYTTLLKLKDQAEAKGDTKRVKELEARMAAINTKGNKLTRINPQTGMIEIIEGGEIPGGLNSPVVTELQKQVHAYNNSMALLSHAERNMNASDFGIRGAVKDLRAKVGGQFGLDVDPQQLDVRNTLKLLRQDLYKSIRSDSNITAAEQKQIAAMLPQVETLDVIESHPNAMSKLLTVKRVLTEKTRAVAEKLGTLPPAWAMEPEEIGKAVAAGKMTEEEAVQALMTFHPEKVLGTKK